MSSLFVQGGRPPVPALASQFPTQKRTHTQQNSSWEATTGRRVRKEIAEYIISWDLGKKEIKYLEHKNLQLVQSSTTKAENLENDFTQIAVKVQEGRKVVQVLVGTGRGPRLVKYLRVKYLTRWSRLSKAASLPSRLFLWSEVRKFWISVNEDLPKIWNARDLVFGRHRRLRWD